MFKAKGVRSPKGFGTSGLDSEYHRCKKLTPRIKTLKTRFMQKIKSVKKLNKTR